jgi:hypothetical protein
LNEVLLPKKIRKFVRISYGPLLVFLSLYAHFKRDEAIQISDFKEGLMAINLCPKRFFGV